MGDPIDAIKAMMEERGLRNVDLTEIFGTKSRASEILRRKRALQVAHIRRLHKHFGMDPSVLIQEYALNKGGDRHG